MVREKTDRRSQANSLPLVLDERFPSCDHGDQKRLGGLRFSRKDVAAD